MPPASPDTPPSNVARWLAWPYRLLMLAGASAAFAAIWVVLAWSGDGQFGWMAVLGALDVAWILRLSDWPRGPMRALVGAAATAAIVIAANWWIIAVHMGQMLGFDPLESAVRLGVQHAWLLAGLANGGFEWAMYAMAIVVGWFASR